MRRNSVLTFLKEKSFIIVLTLTLLSAGTMAALFALGGDKNNTGDEVAKHVEEQVVENARVSEKTLEDQTAAVPKTTTIKKTIDTKESVSKNIETAPDSAAESAELEDQYLDSEVTLEELAEVSGSEVLAEGFSEAEVLSLQWPVDGEVLLPFSMDQSIYFATLAQYQYNPAMMISAPEGTDVTACAAGTVTDVGKSNEYGHYVTMDLGDGFMLTYGQLIDITTEVGESLDAGERFAMVGYPTGNYIAEGENLYLKLTQNDVPVDPGLYLD